MNPAIRIAQPEDAETIAQFQEAMALETEGLALNGPTLRAGVEAMLNDPAKGQYYLAEIDSQIAGCMMLTNEWSDWRNGTVLWFQSVYILPEFRRRGLFREFYQYAKSLVQADSSLAGLRLYVETENNAARKTYEAMGMDSSHYATYEWLKPAPSAE